MSLVRGHHIRYKDKEIFFHMVFKSSVRMADHMYDAPCFIYTVQATGSVSNAHASVYIENQEGILMRCGSYINQWNKLDSEERVEIIIIKLPADVVAQIFSEIQFKPPKSGQRPALALKANQDILLKKYMDSLLFYFNNPAIVNDDLAYLKLKELVLLLLQLPDTDTVKGVLLHLFDTERFTVLQIVEHHLCDNFTVEQLAHFANMSKSTFQRKFKQYTNLPVQKYIQDKRLDKALHLLKDGNSSVADICYACGFSDPNYFSKVFKQKFNQTPRAFQQGK